MTVSQTVAPVEINALSSVLQTLFGPTANELATTTQFIVHQRELTGAAFVQGLTFGWLANPNASYSQL